MKNRYDPNAWRKHYTADAQDLRQTAYYVGLKKTDNHHDAEEIASEVIEAAHNYYERYGRPRNPEAWATRTAKNKAYDRFRKLYAAKRKADKEARKNSFDENTHEVANSRDLRENPHDHLVNREAEQVYRESVRLLASKVPQVVASLSTNMHQFYRLYYIEKKTIAQVVAEMGTSRATVNRLKRSFREAVLEQLREHLTPALAEFYEVAGDDELRFDDVACFAIKFAAKHPMKHTGRPPPIPVHN